MSFKAITWFMKTSAIVGLAALSIGIVIGTKLPSGTAGYVVITGTTQNRAAAKDYFDLAKKYDLDPIHMSLAFCKERPFMGSVIFGAISNYHFITISRFCYPHIHVRKYQQSRSLFFRQSKNDFGSFQRKCIIDCQCRQQVRIYQTIQRSSKASRKVRIKRF